MEDDIVKTKRGIYGRVNITLPIHIKTSLMEFQKKSRLKKSEFLRMALVTGYISLLGGIKKIELPRQKDKYFPQSSTRT